MEVFIQQTPGGVWSRKSKLNLTSAQTCEEITPPDDHVQQLPAASFFRSRSLMESGHRDPILWIFLLTFHINAVLQNVVKLPNAGLQDSGQTSAPGSSTLPVTSSINPSDDLKPPNHMSQVFDTFSLDI